MPKIKKSSKPDIPLIFLKWLVTALTVVMVLGFLFLVSIIGIKILNFNTTTQTLTEPSNTDIFIPDGKIQSIDIEDNSLKIVIKIEAGHFKILVVNLKDGRLLNQYSIKQKKTLYNEQP